MPHPRDPDEVEQTLVPDAPARAPAGLPRGAERTAKPADTSSPPGAADATLETPPSPSLSATDPGDTLPSDARPAAPSPSTPGEAVKSDETRDGTEATLLPPPARPPAPVIGLEATDVDSTPAPDDRTLASGGSTGPLGDDTVPVSVSGGPGGRAGPSPAATGTMVGRFALKDLHASGGLGEVFKARDTELNREVAVKRIKSHYADDPGSRRRFLTEAELTARLDHPGVVPVFGLVTDVRGRPCYAMRFIRGETLKDEIDRYYKPVTGDGKQGAEARTTGPEAAGASGPAPAPAVPRSVAFRHLLARFIATCQAIAYAHSRNIIHRDIKPANVMVGAFGETLVVDWGLAKSLDAGPDFDRVMRAAAGLRHDPDATDLPSHMTLAGTAVGTPAYMAPEQAAGELDAVGPRADVYALGATLYVILTGQAPFAGKPTAEVLELVRRGAHDPASAVNPECPKPLEAIARKAMALRPEDRYATALELAADVERWLSDEPVSCYRDPPFARLARWMRRHPAWVAAAGSLLLAGLLAAGGIAAAIREGQKRTREEQERTLVALDRAVEAEKQRALERDRVAAQERLTAAQRDRAENQERQTAAARNAAAGRYEKAVYAYNVLISDIDRKMAGRENLQELRVALLTNATKGLEKLIEDGGGQVWADRTLVAAYQQAGDLYLLLGRTDKARRDFQLAVDRARDVRDEVRKGTSAEQRAADRDLGRSLEKLAGLLLQTGESGRALTAIDEAISYFAALAQDKADAEAQADLARALAQRAAILLERGETGRAIEDSEQARAAREALAAAAPNDPERNRDFAASLDALTELCLRTGRTAAAVASAERAVRIRKALADHLPDQTDWVRDLAAAHARLGEVNVEGGQLSAARKWYGEGVRGLKELVAKDPMNAAAKAELAAMCGQLGQVQLRTGDIEEAVASMKFGRERAAELQKADPDSATVRRDLALAREQYGDALLAAGDIAAGLREYAESRALLSRLQKADADSARAKLDLARALERFGDGCLVKPDAAGAVVALEESVALRREVVKTDPGSARANRDLAVGLYKLAGAQWSAGKRGAAGRSATEATDLFEKLEAADRASARARRDLALAYGKWGQLLVDGGHLTGALIAWQSSLDQCVKLVKVDGANVQAREDEAAAWERLAGFYSARGNTGRALAAARTAVERWVVVGDRSAKTKAGRCRLALAMLRCGDINIEVRQFAAARDWYAKAEQEIGPAAGDRLLEQVAEQIARQQKYLKAVEGWLANPAAAPDVPVDVRVAALRTVVNLELRADHPTTAAAAAAQLAKVATAPGDLFAAARGYAECAAARRIRDGNAKDEYAADAVALLKRAIAAGFRDADALTGPEWDAVRTRARDFAAVRAELEKLQGDEK